MNDKRRYYTPRPCGVCGNGEAAFAVQVLSRTVGLGQGRKNRKMKLSSTVLLCPRCSRESVVYLEHLESKANEALKHISRSGRVDYGPGLFDPAAA